MAEDYFPCFRFDIPERTPNKTSEVRGNQNKAKVAMFVENIIDNYMKEEPHNSYCEKNNTVAPRMNWTSDLKLVTEKGTVPYWPYRIQMHASGSDWDTLSLNSAVSASVVEESRKYGTRGRQYNNKTPTLTAQASAASESVSHHGITSSDSDWSASSSSSLSLDLTTSMESLPVLSASGSPIASKSSKPKSISSGPRGEFSLNFYEIISCDSAARACFNSSIQHASPALFCLASGSSQCKESANVGTPAVSSRKRSYDVAFTPDPSERGCVKRRLLKHSASSKKEEVFIMLKMLKNLYN